jgi:hypothetical protein
MKCKKHLSERPVFFTTTYSGWMLHQLLAVSSICLILWVLTCAYGSAPVAMAGTLNIKAQAKVNMEKQDWLHVTAKAFNHGDEEAHNVQISILLLDEALKGPVRTVLGVNHSDAFQVEKVISGIKPGTYPLTVMVDFHDANAYPFSALVGTTFNYKKDVKADLRCVAHDLTVEKAGEMRLEVRNEGVDSLHVRATPVLPRELTTPRPQFEFQIAPKDEKTIFFEIVNASALRGATYPVFCYLEYDVGDTHYTTVDEAMVRIARLENWLQRSQWFWLGIAILLGIAIIVYQFKSKRIYKRF